MFPGTTKQFHQYPNSLSVKVQKIPELGKNSKKPENYLKLLLRLSSLTYSKFLLT